jgi:hypothetical protein
VSIVNQRRDLEVFFLDAVETCVPGTPYFRRSISARKIQALGRRARGVLETFCKRSGHVLEHYRIFQTGNKLRTVCMMYDFSLYTMTYYYLIAIACFPRPTPPHGRQLSYSYSLNALTPDPEPYVQDPEP